MTTWLLVVCVGVSWAGCAKVWESEYPDAESCYEAIEAIRGGSRGEDWVASCLRKD